MGNVLQTALAPVTVGAEHLAVLRDGLAALRPQRDVVGLHFLDGELLAALRAFASLPRVGGKPLFIVKCANAQMPFVAVVDLIDGLFAGLLREEIDVLALVARRNDTFQSEDFETAREVLEEVATARVVAVAEDGLAPELVAVVPHLVLDVGELCVVLVVLLALRAVDCRVQRSFHGWGYYNKLSRHHGTIIIQCRITEDNHLN